MYCVVLLCVSIGFRFNIGDPQNNIESFHIYVCLFNIGEARNTIESCKFQCVTFSILVSNVLFPN